MVSTAAAHPKRQKRKAEKAVHKAGLPAEPVPVKQGDSIPKHIRAGLDKNLRAMVAHDPGTRLGEDAEELHQMRVAVRRMRALLKSGRPFLDTDWSEPLRSELGWLGRALGPVRDLDVLLERLHEETSDLDDDERSAAARLISGLEIEHTQARQELLAALDSDRYIRLAAALAKAVRNALPTSKSSVDGRSTLHGMVTTQFRKLRKSVEKGGQGISDAELHALRIQGKRLRYTAELASSISNKRARRLVSATKDFQDVLGEHQDACVAEERVRELLRGLGQEADAEVAFVAGRLVEREQVRRDACRDRWWSFWLALRKRAEQL
jgi:CHAD domain-containing protein